MDAILDVLLRWAHLFPVIVMVGGAVGGKYLNTPLAGPLSRNSVFVGILLLFGSGLTNLMKMMTTVPKGWHMWFGIKFLLALHVLAMVFLLTKPDATAEKRSRWQASALISTAVIVAISAYLRYLRAS
jgi:hypothetical protein